VEAVYTSEEAQQWSLREDWNLILVDDALSPRSGVEILHELKRNSPHAAIILQTDRHDSTSALRALQQGADFLLFKESPGFITELLFYTQEAIEKRALETKLEQTFQRHLRLLESLSDLVYELDHEGRFVYVSPTITSLLGYAPEDLAGQHFSMLLPPSQEGLARYHMNERRTGIRSAHQLELYVMGKGSDGTDRITLMQLSAKGLYDERRRYLGTVGLLRDVSAQREHLSKLHALETKLEEADRELAASRDAAFSSQHLQRPLTALLQDSQRLLTTLQSLRFDQQVSQLASYAEQAAQMGHEVWKAVQFRGHHIQSISLNSILNEVLSEFTQERRLLPDMAQQRFGSLLPDVAGNPEEMRELFRILIPYALQAAAGHRLLLETYALKLGDSAADPPQAIVSPPLRPYVVAVIRQQADTPPMTVQPLAAGPSIARVSGPDFVRVYEIVRQHGGSIEIGSAPAPSLHIAVRLPASLSPSLSRRAGDPSEPEPVSMACLFPATPSRNAVTPSDRLRSGRLQVRVPLELSIGTTAWQATIVEIGLGGMVLVSSQPTPPIEHQPVYLVIRTSVSFLELQGTIRSRMPGPSVDVHPASFMIEFMPLTDPDAAILASFIETLQESPVALTIEGLIPHATERLMSVPSPPSLRQERRWYLRTQFARPVRLLRSSDNEREWFTGLLLNLGKGGACIQITGLSEAEAARLSLEGSLQALVTDASTLLHLPIRIVWTAQQAANDIWHVGISFQRLGMETEERLLAVLAGRLLSFDPSEHGASGDRRGTTLIALGPRQGGSLVLSHDAYSNRLREESPILIISPGYAQTRVDYLGLAAAFGASGFRILRYDPTGGLGLSDGDPRLVTLSSLKDDLDTMMEYARAQWPRAPLAVLASDLSARVALRLLGQRTVDLLLLVDPTLDLSGILLTLHHRDLVEEHRTGTRFGLINLIGLPLDADCFLHDAITEGYVDFPSAIHDIRLSQCHMLFLQTSPAGKPFAGSMEKEGALIQRVIELVGDRAGTISLPYPISGEEALSENGREACRILMTRCKDLLSARGAAFGSGHQTGSEDILTQFRHESEQLRIRPRITKSRQADLWASYTQHVDLLSEIPAYYQHSNALYQTIHPFRSRQHVLDLGCGDYGFARLWLLNEFYRSSSRPFAERSHIDYLGVDMHMDGVRSARHAFTAIGRQTGMLPSGMPTAPPPVSSRWLVSDEDSFPFGSELFDCIVCHLLLSFTGNPVVTLREIYRLLRPNGTLIVSCFTPSTNLAAVYYAHLEETRQDGLSGRHRNLLLDLAGLYESIRSGRLHSFTDQSLSALFGHITARPVRTFSSLGGHVLIATVQKPDSAR
jgi:PAS domain S-box-containing protein